MSQEMEQVWPRHGDTVQDLTDSNRGFGVVYKVDEVEVSSAGGRPSLMVRWGNGQISRRDPMDVEVVERAYRKTDGPRS